MQKLYSYILRYDDGAAPNPFWNICTLVICKPVIRLKAQQGDWVIGTGSKNSKISEQVTVDLSDSMVYAMKISDVKSLEEYDKYCRQNLQNKIPNLTAEDWRLRMGDCIYDYSRTTVPVQREGVHIELNISNDLSGENALLSDHFYYFGSGARPFPPNLKQLIKRNQGHLIIEKKNIIQQFENWIQQFELNRIYADAQLRWYFDKAVDQELISKCSKWHLEEDEINIIEDQKR